MRRLLAARNIGKALILYGALAGGLFALGWWIGNLRLASVFLVVGLLMAATVFWYGPRVILASLGARELQLAESPALHSTVERLALVARVERPKLYLMKDGHPRALSVGRGASASGIAFTQGLVTLLSPAELEGVLAHEMAHARHRDSLVQTPVVLIANWLVEASRIGGFLERALLFVLGPIAASIVQVFLSAKRELAADLRAAEICGSPHPLADALVRIEQAEELVRFQGSPVTEPLYIVNPFEPVGLAAMFSTHPAGWRARRAPARARPRVARPAAGRLGSRDGKTFSRVLVRPCCYGLREGRRTMTRRGRRRSPRSYVAALLSQRRVAPPRIRSRRIRKEGAVHLGSATCRLWRRRSRPHHHPRPHPLEDEPRERLHAPHLHSAGPGRGHSLLDEGSTPATVDQEHGARRRHRCRPLDPVVLPPRRRGGEDQSVDRPLRMAPGPAWCGQAGAPTRASLPALHRRLRRPLNEKGRLAAALSRKTGGDLLSREVALRVPSAQAGLTSLFGMGRGVSPPL